MEPSEGDLRVWWVPQVPMPAFYVPVADVREGLLLLDALAEYDLFQFENRIKPDYSNAGGLEVFEDGEWHEWESADGLDVNEMLPPMLASDYARVQANQRRRIAELAYDDGFHDAEVQHDGFIGVSGWTNHNPHRKEEA